MGCDSGSMIFRIATWNVNSIRRRLPSIKRLVDTTNPDIICLQETKVEDNKFPTLEMAALGYKEQAIYGQKSYHGVAICSRHDLSGKRHRDWAGTTEARHVYCWIHSTIKLHNFYVPAGGDQPNPQKNKKFQQKLLFLEELTTWFSGQTPSRAILVGDLNIAPLENDVWSHQQLINVVSHTPVEVAALNKLMRKGGWIDAVRHLIPETDKLFTWWSYRSSDWKASNRGRRLDHIWVTPDLIENVKSAWVVDSARGWPVPSDHAPVVMDIDL